MKHGLYWGIFFSCLLLAPFRVRSAGNIVPNGFTSAGAETHYGTPVRKQADGSIFDYMDGGGIVYLDHGFRALVHREFLDHEGRRITFDRFTMETAAQAMAALADERIAPAGGKALPLDAPNKGYKFPPDYFIYMVLDRDLVYLHTDDDALAGTLDQFAADIIKSPKEGIE
jgi:hypothetical protein